MFQTYNPDQFILFDAIASERDFAKMWKMTDWRHVRSVVSGFQNTIANAAAENDLLEIERQQKRIIDLPEAKMLAVDLVTRKKSRFTPGVDGILWKTPAEKMYASLHLDAGSYHASPVLRFFLPRSNTGKVRPVGIPTMNDRAMQMLFTFALQPVAEVWGDPDSFGFRVSRSARDACTVIRQYLQNAGKRVWVLDADIENCFDRILHPWLFRHIPFDRPKLKEVLTSGYMFDEEYHSCSQGIPQGGIISPVLANMTLDGIEGILHESHDADGSKLSVSYKRRNPDIQFVRYADDFIVLAESETLIEGAYDLIASFLATRGLAFSPGKTRIIPFNRGFDFLHWHFQEDGDRVSITPSESSVTYMQDKISEIFKGARYGSSEYLIHVLNPLLRGYAYYHRESDALPVFRSLDARIRRMFLQRIEERNHTNTGVSAQLRSLLIPEFPEISAGEETLFSLSTVMQPVSKGNNRLRETVDRKKMSVNLNKKTGKSPSDLPIDLLAGKPRKKRSFMDGYC